MLWNLESNFLPSLRLPDDLTSTAGILLFSGPFIPVYLYSSYVYSFMPWLGHLE
jgi:hypothetical protein